VLPSRPLRFSSATADACPQRSRRSVPIAFALLSLLVFGLPKWAWAQAGQPLITQTVDNTKLTVLKGNTHPLARAQYDHGPAPATLSMQRMLLVLTRSAQQEAGLQTLLQEQQYKSSPSFHKWLTPQEFGEQFGPAEQDVQTIVAWLTSEGFQVASVSNGRTVIEFSGTAAQVQQAFHTTIHSYVVNGEQHWANASDPEIPSALAPVVVGVDGLNSFRSKAQHLLANGLTLRKMMGETTTAKPQFNLQCDLTPSGICNLLGPYDFATIYNVLPLWNATPAIDGTGESIALIGRSNINLQDVADFRSIFGLPANVPQVILDGPDPGLTPDETEADLDVEWSGAVAKNATIKLVVSESTETTDGVDLSAEYAVDNNVAPVISESFGNCELALGTAEDQFYNDLWEQAAAQGISVFVSAGDNGSAGCDSDDNSPPAPAQFGLAVNGFGSTPYNVSVGGTDFNDFFNPGTYWSTSSNPTTLESALGYIPETTWNDSCTNAIFGQPQIGFSTDPETNCNNEELEDFVVTVGGSGGQSNCTAPTGNTPSSCSGGYTKPPFQTGTGVPNDGKRDMPDVSLFASNGFVGNSYVICEADLLEGSCSATNIIGIGGTSASSPTFAALQALVDESTGSPQGNPNFVYYKLAAQVPASSCNSSTGPASTCVFNDVTSGTNAMPCATGSPDCTTATPGDSYGVLSGYNTGVGYDLATGLGSVNANNLVKQWNSVTFTPSSTTLSSTDGTPISITHGTAVNFNVSVTPTSPEPTGAVSLLATQGNNTFGFDTLSLNSSGTATGSTNMLPGGTSYTVTAHYGGDTNYGGSTSNALTVTVTPETSKTDLHVVTFNPNTGAETSANATTFTYGSLYLLRADITNSSGSDCFAAGTSTAAYACPTGSVAITDNGTALTSSPFGLNSEGNTEDQTIQLTGGTHNLVANYSGDNSYDASSATDAVTVTTAPTTTSASGPADVIIGASFSLTVTTNTQSSGVAPTGTYSVFDGTTQLSQTSVSCTPATSTQFAACQSNINVSVSGAAGAHTLTVQYSGDQNYAASTSGPVTVTAVPDFSLSTSASPLVITAGQSGTATITVTPATNDSSTVQLSCATVFPGGSCTSSPTSVSLSNGTAATAMVTISTLAPSTSTTTGSASMAVHRSALFLFRRGPWWTLSLLAGLAALFLTMVPGRQKSRETAMGMALVCVLSFAIGCGGGANASGGGGSQAFSTTTTLSASATKSPQGTSVTLTATVQSSAPSPPTGSVTFNSSNCEYSQFANLTNGTGQLQFLGGPVPVGTCTVTAQYGGDANNLASTSGALNITFTGTTQAQVTGQTGTDAHTTTVTVTIQ
jgi:subtilase family serine protease